jgi:hypothetical protein
LFWRIYRNSHAKHNGLALTRRIYNSGRKRSKPLKSVVASFKNSPQRAAGNLAGDPAPDSALDALFFNGVHIAHKLRDKI